MSLTNSNTYIEPTATTSINSARLKQNDTFRSLLANFYSTEFPTSINLTAEGVSLALPDGMLYRNETSGLLYVLDTANKPGSSPIASSFTRRGLGSRTYDTNTELQADLASIETGELSAALDQGTVYLCTAANTLVDLGTPSAYVVDVNNNVTISSARTSTSELYSTSLWVDEAVTHNGGAAKLAFTGSDDIVLSTSDTTRVTFTAAGEINFNSDLNIPEYLYHKGNNDTYLRYQTNSISFATSGVSRFDVDSSGIFHVSGNSTFDATTTISSTVAGAPGLKVLKPVNDTNKTPALIVASDGEPSDVLAVFRGNTEAEQVDVTDNYTTADDKFTIYGDGRTAMSGSFTAIGDSTVTGLLIATNGTLSTSIGYTGVTYPDASVQAKAAHIPTFDSGELAFASGVTNIAHGLGRAPATYEVYLKCITAEHGYVAGDMSPIKNMVEGSGLRGYVTYCNTTNVVVSWPSPAYIVSTSAGLVTMNTANWKLVVYAW